MEYHLGISVRDDLPNANAVIDEIMDSGTCSMSVLSAQGRYLVGESFAPILEALSRYHSLVEQGNMRIDHTYQMACGRT
jgi:hypothetical protein